MSADENKSLLASNYQNDSFSLAAASSIIFHAGKGTDTATDRYLNLPSEYSYGIEVIPTVACSITEINEVALKSAISVPITGYVAKTGKFRSIKILAGTATVLEIGGRC